MQNQTGFTLVELVVVILIGGILAVTVLPKFFSVEDETLQGQRDQLLALTHQLQQQSMQDTANLSATCPTLVMNTTAAGFASSNACLASASFVVDSTNPQQIVWQSGAVVKLDNLPLAAPLLLRFDSWGRPQGACVNGCSIGLQLNNIEQKICLNSSGYIQLC